MPVRLPFDRVATIYDATRGLPPKLNARLLHLLVEQLRGKRVLEIGVGTGRFAVPLQKSGIRVVGIDISHDMVALGRAKGLRDVVFADGARLPFASGSFDVTMANHVLHLLPDWKDVLLDVAGVTRESFSTIIEHVEMDVDLQKEYHRLAEARNYSWHAPGLHERDLPKVLPPDLVMPVGPFEDVVSADAVLKELEARAFSSLWDAPEDVHREVLAALRSEWSGREVRRSLGADVCFWRIERLAELARRAPQTS